jgi:hypothetical protein
MGLIAIGAEGIALTYSDILLVFMVIVLFSGFVFRRTFSKVQHAAASDQASH